MELITEVQNETVVKTFLLPVWVILGITWLAVHILVSIFSIFHGLWKVFFTLIAILAVAFGMYQNAIVSVITIAVTFLILLAGTAIEVFLEYTTRKIGRRIVI